jgi:hypothetical protein
MVVKESGIYKIYGKKLVENYVQLGNLLRWYKS